MSFLWLVLLIACYWALDQLHDPTKWIYGAVIAMLLCLNSTAGAVNVTDQVNDQRMRMDLDPWLPDAGLQAAAEAGAAAQARRGRAGHCGTMPSGSAEGAGRGRVGPPFSLSTCFHMHGDYTTSYRYGAAAIVGGFATVSLDNNRQRGEIGSAKRGLRNRPRRGLLARIFGRRNRR